MPDEVAKSHTSHLEQVDDSTFQVTVFEPSLEQIVAPESVGEVVDEQDEQDDRPYHLQITAMPETERPRERLRDYGPSALSNAELLAILLRTGNKGESAIALGYRLLNELGGLTGLSGATFEDFASFHGLGPAKAAQLQAALELGRRIIVASPESRPRITSPTAAANYLMLQMSGLVQEQVRVILLDTKNFIISDKMLYQGNVNSAVIRVSELFRDAIRRNATSMIVAHNHPSGDPEPSDDDIRITRRIIEGGHILNIDVVDHIIVGHQSFVSMRERGLGFD